MDHEEVVVRKARKPRLKRSNADALEEQRPEQVENNKGDADQLSAAEKSMKEVNKVLRKKCKVKEGDPIEVDGVQFLFNPKSFTQTVENIFHFSFLIKKSEAAIGVRSHEEADGAGKLPGLWVKAVHNDENDDDAQPAPSETTQAVVPFTMRDWRRICQSHQLESGILKHRTGSKHTRATKLS